MQKEWKEECLAAANEALVAFPIVHTQVELISQSENYTFYVKDSENNPYVLRIHRPEYHTLEELQSEQLWTEAMKRSGIDVPVSVRTKEGAGYTSVVLGSKTRYAGMLEWVEGNPLSDTIAKVHDTENLAEWFSILGRLMASLHEHAVNWSVPEHFKRHSFDVDGFTGENPFWGRYWETPALTTKERQDLKSFRKLLQQILHKFGSMNDAYSLIHADLHPHNVIVNEERLHIIDFDDCGFGWHAYDLAVALYNERHSHALDRLLEVTIKGYEEVRPIADQTVDVIPLFFIIRNLASIGWISARPDLNRDITAVCRGLFEDTRANLDEALARSGL